MSCIAFRRTAGVLSQPQICSAAMYSLTSFQQTSCPTQQGFSQTCADAGPAGATPRQPSQQQLRAYAADAPDPLMVPLSKQQQQQPHSPATMQRQEAAVALPPSNKGPWERVIDKPTGQPYWWNAESGVTTPVGASKPDAWVAVVDPQTKAQYFWNKDSGETTAVGEPLPGPEGRLATRTASQRQQMQAPSVMSVLTNSLAMGFGMGLMFAIARMLF